MDNQPTSFRVMTTHEFDDAVFYRASCACTDKRCDLHLSLERDKEFNTISLELNDDMYYYSFQWIENPSWFLDKWYRIKGAIRILFTGRIKINNSFIFQGEDHIQDFLNALNSGMEKFKKNDEIKPIL